ncbi:hypothetical protein BJ875DRAFT_452835 [Amylocarpus encephaloides]|uniref:Secreted protein n=1 Tax=Amylocarpus encephaloides TaxID=45428 RepID=A0A9P7YQD0_9HELO|nr:hypothetical protein BJ875DRAFT_452835 [Amylocarpus encephaloides]
MCFRALIPIFALTLPEAQLTITFHLPRPFIRPILPFTTQPDPPLPQLANISATLVQLQHGGCFKYGPSGSSWPWIHKHSSS